jgi:hypothetical protein
MAKQAGAIFIEGSFDDLCFYRMDGKYYVRMKAPLVPKRFGSIRHLKVQERAAGGLQKATSLLPSFAKWLRKRKEFTPCFAF